MILDFDKATIQSIDFLTLAKVDVLRLDAIDPLISGNKWFKLKYFLEKATQEGKNTIATFGGAYSNHIAATAMACKRQGLQSIGYIRGEKPAQLSATLQTAIANGMSIQYVDRNTYRNEREMIMQSNDAYQWVDEGGAGIVGAKGAAEIASLVKDFHHYDYVYTAMGTGTTLAGLINASDDLQTIVGVSVLKNNGSLLGEVRSMLAYEAHNFSIREGYHFGGYAKKTEELLQFMRDVYAKAQLPLDFVYTAKAFWGLMQDISIGFVPIGSRVLFIHTGGLQGNVSLDDKTLHF